jgi:ribonuclease BN (tRNA processing enzyme)
MVDGWPHAFQAMARIFDDHMGNGFFPVAFDQLKARIDFLNRLSRGPLTLDGVRIESIALNHPQGGLGYRFQEEDQAMAFITDNELGADQGRRFGNFVRFVQGCNLLIHDAQYLPEEMEEHRGWGHSNYEEVVHLAAKAGVRRLILTHHDPSRTDTQVEEIIARARQLAAALAPRLTIDAAREGDSYRLP